MKQTNEKKTEVRMCYTCGVKPRMKSNSYCSRCHTERTGKAQAKGRAKQEGLVVKLASVETFVASISRSVLDLELEDNNDTRRYLRGVIDRQVTNLGFLASGVIKAQIN